MKRIILTIFVFFVAIATLHAQTIYEFAFQFTAGNSNTDYRLLFVDNNDGTGKFYSYFTGSIIVINKKQLIVGIWFTYGILK